MTRILTEADKEYEQANIVWFMQIGCPGCTDTYEKVCPDCNEMCSFDLGVEGHICSCGYYDGFK